MFRDELPNMKGQQCGSVIFQRKVSSTCLGDELPNMKGQQCDLEFQIWIQKFNFFWYIDISNLDVPSPN